MKKNRCVEPHSLGLEELCFDELVSISGGGFLDDAAAFAGEVVGTLIGAAACTLKCISNKIGITSPKAN